MMMTASAVYNNTAHYPLEGLDHLQPIPNAENQLFGLL